MSDIQIKLPGSGIDDVATGIALSVILSVLLIGLALVIWNIVLLSRMWNSLEGWAKAMYLILLFSGVGPVPGILLLYMKVGVTNML
jgi:hypothetical protein